MITRYTCPLAETSDCRWVHLDEAVPCVPGWEAWATYEHSFTSRTFKSLTKHHLEVEQVLFAHLETHTAAQWLVPLRALREPA